MSSFVAPTAASTSKVPDAVEHSLPDGSKRSIQINFCKNPTCANFGVPASGRKHARRALAPAAPGLEYTLSGSGDGTVVLYCRLCSEMPPVKSNQGISEELRRITRYQQPVAQVTCPNEACTNHSVALGANGYKKFGKTSQGSQRYQCLACKKTFSVAARATHRQRLPRLNTQVLSLLLNKMPLTRMCEVLDISPQTLYDKIDFVHRQCLAFAARKERELAEALSGRKCYLAVDRQDYVVNWSLRKDRRNVTLRAIGSADLDSGFVFGMHLNFDSHLDTETVERQAAAVDDYTTSQAFRRFARLWLEPDYAKAVRFDDIAATLAPGTPRHVIEVLMMKQEMAAAATHGKWLDRWMRHPLPNAAEPEKAICYLTDLGDYDEDHRANLFLKASLHPIDRFFMQVRRRLNMLERPIGTASKAGRTWYGYSAYQPANIEKLLDIFRVFYNYAAKGQDGKTPAMRLGLTDKVFSKAELLGM